MKISRYTHITYNDKLVYLTSLTTRTVLQLDTTVWESICKSLERGTEAYHTDPELMKLLEDSCVLVPKDKNELDDIIKRTIVARSVSSTFGLVLVPTMTCNMNCHYCFEDKSDLKSFDANIIKNICNFIRLKFENNNYSSLHVRWFGGEPLMQINVILETMERLAEVCDELGKRITGDIVTNGFDLTLEASKRISNVGIESAQVTFDGDKKQHNKVRRIDKSGSYDVLIKNLLNATDLIDVRARIHVAPYNLDGVPSLLMDLQKNGLHKKLKYIYFAPLFNYKQSNKTESFKKDNRLFLNSYDFSKVVINLTKQAKKLGFMLADPLDTDYSVCTALREYTTVVNPDGSLLKCYMDAGDNKETFGVLDNGISKKENLSKWRKSAFFNDPICQECNFAPVCLGGCAKEVMTGADKSIICTPLKYNIHEIVPLHYND